MYRFESTIENEVENIYKSINRIHTHQCISIILRFLYCNNILPPLASSVEQKMDPGTKFIQMPTTNLSDHTDLVYDVQTFFFC